MAHRKLPNYLLTHRKRAGFTNDEVAFLLGCKRETVSRHEAFSRPPALKIALTYQAIFGASVAELFAGLYAKVEKEAADRAKAVLQTGKVTGRKADYLRAIAVTPEINEENQ